MWAKIRAKLGNIWGEFTTQTLAVIGVIQYVTGLQDVKTLLAGQPWVGTATTALLVLNIAAILLRRYSPPPPSVAIQEGSKATVLSDNTIAIQTQAPLSDAVVEAAATKPDVPAVVTG